MWWLTNQQVRTTLVIGNNETTTLRKRKRFQRVEFQTPYEDGASLSPSTWGSGSTLDRRVLSAPRSETRGRNRARERDMASGLHVRHTVVPVALLASHDDFRLHEATVMVAQHSNARTVHLGQHPVARAKGHQRSIMEGNAYIVQIGKRHV
jgi:hypothetical protein